MSPLTRRQLFGAAAGFVLCGTGMALPARAVTINPRESWAVDRPPTGPLESENVRFLLVHHSASRNGHTGADAPGIIRSFYDYHTSDEKGWNDVAYNFLIDSDGGIWEGRAGSLTGPVAGDATGGNQGFSQLVCVIGDYSTARPTQASLTSLVSLLAWLADRYGISTTPGAEVMFTSRGSNKHPAGTSIITPTITGHREMSYTTCPGNNLNAYVAGGLTADVEMARTGSVPTPTTAPTTSSTSTTPVAASSTVPPSAAVIPSIPVMPASSASFPASTTTVPTTTSSAAPTTSLPDPSTTVPVAVAVSAGGSVVPTGIIATAGAFVISGASLLLWRHRRMREAEPPE